MTEKNTHSFPDRLKLHLNEKLWECVREVSDISDLYLMSYICQSGNERYRIYTDPGYYRSAQRAITHELPDLRRLAGMS